MPRILAVDDDQATFEDRPYCGPMSPRPTSCASRAGWFTGVSDRLHAHRSAAEGSAHGSPGQFQRSAAGSHAPRDSLVPNRRVNRTSIHLSDEQPATDRTSRQLASTERPPCRGPAEPAGPRPLPFFGARSRLPKRKIKNPTMRQAPRRSNAMAAGVVTVLLCAADASADTSRITLVFRPAAATNPFAVEIANGAPRHGIALPSLTLTGGPSGLRLGGYTTQLPTIKVRGMSLAPRYGDQQFSFDFQPAALTGMTPGARAVRGLAVTLGGSRVSGTLLAGRLSSDTASLLGSAVPSVFVFSATLKPAPKVAISPRLATALVRPGNGHRIDSTLGLGLRAELSRHVSIVGDAGGTRMKSGRWAQLGAVGALGRWSRGSFEASASHAGAGVTLLGSVPSRERIEGWPAHVCSCCAGRASKVSSLRPGRLTDRAI